VGEYALRVTGGPGLEARGLRLRKALGLNTHHIRLAVINPALRAVSHI
jgi:hypothetical protein